MGREHGFGTVLGFVNLNWLYGLEGIPERGDV